MQHVRDFYVRCSGVVDRFQKLTSSSNLSRVADRLAPTEAEPEHSDAGSFCDVVLRRGPSQHGFKVCVGTLAWIRYEEPLTAKLFQRNMYSVMCSLTLQ